jgi:hypothetical protein
MISELDCLMENLKSLFGTAKPIIAMVHFPALPGTPRHDATICIDGMVERMRRDLRYLLDGGVDAVMFCNEDDRPYAFHADFAAVAVMTRVIAELRPKDRPFGVDFLWDAKAALAVAKATGAAFIREVVTGNYESDMGLWSLDAAGLYRYRKQIGAEDVRIFDNICPEFASPLGTRSVALRARSAVVSSLVDAILISGQTAGSEASLADLKEAKEAVRDMAPVLVNTGVRADTVAKYLEVVDGVIVGSSLKKDGYTWNQVELARVTAFMQAARGAVYAGDR